MDGGHTQTHTLDGIRIVALQGEHDLSTVTGMRRELVGVLAQSSAVIVDATETEFIDTTTLLALIRAHEVACYRGVRFAVVVPSQGFARRVFELVSMPELVPTYATRAAAVAAVTSNDAEDAQASA